MATRHLPSESDDQTYVTLSAFEGNNISLKESRFVTPADDNASKVVPSMAFLITHPTGGRLRDSMKGNPPYRLMFDLGLRSNVTLYMKPIQDYLKSNPGWNLKSSIAEELRAGGIKPDDIDLIVLSHIHYDHHGDPQDFPSTKIAVGNGSVKILHEGLGGIAGHQNFDPWIYGKNQLIELPPTQTSASESTTSAGPLNDHNWEPIGPFDAAMDLFGDGSVFIIDAPGHLPGHLNLLCRIGPKKWAYLAGDSAHDLRLLSGESKVATWKNDQGKTMCIHLDKETAEDTIAKIQALPEAAKETGDEVEVILAHDPDWWKENQHRHFANMKPLKLG